MTVLNKTAQKSFFENGDKPSGTDFANLIDSQLGVADTISIIKSLIADTTALKSVVVSGLPDATFAYVESEGEYFYSASATDTENIPTIVQPASGSGRWFLKNGLGAGINTHSLIRIAATQFSSLSTDATLGGSSPGNTLYPSQAAVKTYADNADSNFFGTGIDGDLTASSGTTVLTTDAYYNNVTLTGTAKIATQGFTLFIKGVLDISAAGASAIYATAPDGGAATGSTAGTASALGTAAGTVGIGTQGTSGAAGTTGVGAQAAASGSTNPSNGGSTGAGGAGGSGGAGAGGAARAGATASIPNIIRFITNKMTFSNSLLTGGCGGPGGGSGAGNGTVAGGGGGAGGNGGSALVVFAHTINRSGSTAANVLQANGGNGGNGGNGNATGNTGGGGGGCGGGAGWVYLVYNALTGSSATNAISASSGTGGTGGNGAGSGAGGSGGSGGRAGIIIAIGIVDKTVSVVNGTGTAANTGGAASGTTGGTGAAARTAQLNL